MKSPQDEPIIGFAVLTGLFLSSLVMKVMLQVLGEVVVAEMWPPIEMRKLDEVVMTELWSPIEMWELGEVGCLLGIKLCGSVPKVGESVLVSKCGGKLVSVLKASVVSVPKAGKPISVSKGGK